MGTLWSIISSFNVLFLFNLWWLDRTDRAPIGVFTPDNRWETVPIFGLSLGSVFTLISLYLLFAYAKKQQRAGCPWYERIPAIWIPQKDMDKNFRKWWLRFVIIICVVFPLAAHVHFWNRFDEWQAWRNYDDMKGQKIGLLETVSPSFLIDWDAHRYGDYSRRVQRPGVSFVPLYQPILMGIFSLAVFVVAVFAIRTIFFLQFNAEDGDDGSSKSANVKLE